MRRIPTLLSATVLCLALGACRSTAPSVPPAERGTIGTGIVLGTTQAPVLSKAEIEQKVAAGDPEATFQLGAMYHDGDGVPRDYARARDLFEKAGQAGERRAQFNLGLMYYKGEGVKQDYVAARRWFTEASRNGNPRSWYELGLMAYLGQGQQIDFDAALENFRKAALLGVADAQFNLGIMAIRGEGMTQDLVEGYAWLTLASKQDFPKAADNLGKLSDMLSAEQRAQGQKRADALKTEVDAAMRAAP